MFDGVVAVGCPDIVLPANSWLRRSGDNAMIRCNDSLETWYLTCQDNHWIGDVTNCTMSQSNSVVTFSLVIADIH